MALLEIKNASFSYDKVDIFENISFCVNKGEIFCLFGPNGCGKSTLLECILGLLRLKEGNIFLDGKNVTTMKPEKIARYISYVPQVHEKSFPYTVLDFVLMGRAPYTSLFSSPKSQDIRIAEEALEILGIIQFKDKPYTQLSGGELQLVMIARALAQKTPIIVMDEPTSHLDFKNDIAILETVTDLVKRKSLTIIMATHFPNHGFYFENNDLPIKVLLMNKQKIVAAGKPSEVLLEENMKQIREALVPHVSDKINIEELIRTRPDVVFIKEETAQNQREIEKLEKTKIPYLIVKDDSIKEQKYAIEMIGKAVGNMEKAEKYVDYYQDCIVKVQEVVSKIPVEKRVKVFHSVNEATRTDARGTLPAEWITKAGAVNVSLGEDLRFTDNKYFASLEQVYLWDPDVILVNEDAAYGYILENEQWASLRAVKEGRVYKMPTGISRWGHPGSLETPLAILWTAKTLYPDKFTDLNMQEETKGFYKTFFNFNLTDKEVAKVLAGIGMRDPKGK